MTAALVVVLACAPERRFENSYYLVEHISESVPVDPSKRPLQVPWIEIDFEREPTLLQHPPSKYGFDDVPSGDDAVVSVGPTMDPRAWETGTDGVGFRLGCRNDEGEWIKLIWMDLSPAQRLEDRGWNRREIPLDRCSSPRTSLELETTCGPASDCRWDWAAWGDPKIVYRQAVEPKVRRLAILISIDTLRPDRMSVYGGERPTTPELERLAADGIAFETAVAPAPWTIPSHASLLTSTDPGLHGATTQRDIHPGVPLLSDILRSAGWATAGFVDTPWLGSFGFDRGYDHYDAESPPPGSSRRGAAVTQQRLLDWLSAATGDAFVFWHLMDIHGAYGAPAPFGGRFRRELEITPDGRLEALSQLAYHDYLQLERFRSFDDLVASYDEAVAAADAQVGRLLEVLRQTGLYDEALIVVTSDHGESFMDHGVWVGHGLFLTDDEIRVPLVVKLPGNRWAGTRVHGLARLIDVAPTILDALGVSAPASFQGRSLVAPRPGSRDALPRAAFGTSSNTGARYVLHGQQKLITEWTVPRGKVISAHLRPRGDTALTARIDSGEKLYDLISDPGETDNRIRSDAWSHQAQVLRELLEKQDARLEAFRRRLPSRESEAELSPEQIRRLKALGYLGGEQN